MARYDCSSIKWRRSGNVRTVSQAGTRKKEMAELLSAERYKEEGWLPGQLFRMLQPSVASHAIDSKYVSHCVSPKLEIGDIVMYLGWFEHVYWEYVPGVRRLVSGPKWIVGGAVYLFMIDRDKVTPVIFEMAGVDTEANTGDDMP